MGNCCTTEKSAESVEACRTEQQSLSKPQDFELSTSQSTPKAPRAVTFEFTPHLQKPKRTAFRRSKSLRHGKTSISGQTTFHLKRLSREFVMMFIVKREVIRDAYGTLLLVEQRNTGKKRIARIVSKTGDKQECDNFAREMEILARLKHPNVLQARQVLEDEENFYLLYESLDGTEVVSYLRIAGKKSELEIAGIAAQLLQTLMFLHANDVVHCNICFRSILFLECESGMLIAKLVGIGASRNHSDPNQSVGGFLAFSSPESFHGLQSEKSDIWACGVVLYFLASKHLPFLTQSKDDLLAEIKDSSPSFPLFPWGSFSPHLQKLIQGMLISDTKLRYSAATCVTHTWLRQHFFAMNVSSPTNALRNMAKFSAGNTMALRTLALVVDNALTIEERLNFIKSFNSLDNSREGKLDKAKLSSALSRLFPAEESLKIAKRLFSALKIRSLRGMTISEFILSSCDRESLFSETRLRTVYEALLLDGSKEISVEDLAEWMGDEKGKVRAMLKEGNQDMVDFREFEKVVQRAMQ